MISDTDMILNTDDGVRTNKMVKFAGKHNVSIMSKARKINSGVTPYKITRLEFCATHFNAGQFPSDMFYVGLANRIYPVIHKVFSAQPGFTAEVSRRMAVVLACYVGDLVAGSGIWVAFISLYKKKYGNSFPFYNIREQTSFFPYSDEYPSFHAVLFLLWYVADGVNPEMVLNPNNPALRMLAMALMPDLAKAFDDAPDTPARPVLMPEKETGIPLFYQIRNLCAWLCDHCYLTRINDWKKATNDFEDFIGHVLRAAGCEDPGAEEYALESYLPMNALIGPLAIPAYEWLAEIVALYHEPEEEVFIPLLAGLKSRPYEYYRYVTVGESEVVLEDTDGTRLTLSASTMPGEKFSPETAPGKSALLSLVFLDGVWLMNGLGLHALSPGIYEECRNAHFEKATQRKETYRYLMKAFGRQRMGVCGSYEEYIRLAYGDNAPDAKVEPELFADIRDAGNLLYFLNTDGTVSILPGWATCVKVKDNPYYDEEEASHDSLALIFDHSLSTPEMREYIIKNRLIPDAGLSSVISVEAGRRLFQKNIRFFNDYSGRDTMPSEVKV